MIRETLFNPSTNNGLKHAKQKGFTLIELIMVIVILGILSAFALPKFADFSTQAEQSSIEGALGGIKSASAIAHAACLAFSTCSNSGASTVLLDGTSVTTVNGYPDVAGIQSAAGLDGYGLNTATAGSLTVFIGGTTIAVDDLCLTYTNAAASGSPTFAPTSGTGTWDTSVTPAVCN